MIAFSFSFLPFIFPLSRWCVCCSHQVNLPSHIYKEIEEGLARPSKRLFFSAQQVIFRLMNADTFPKFLQGPEYRAVR